MVLGCVTKAVRVGEARRGKVRGLALSHPLPPGPRNRLKVAIVVDIPPRLSVLCFSAAAAAAVWPLARPCLLCKRAASQS